jgi:hypothetical protein
MQESESAYNKHITNQFTSTRSKRAEKVNKMNFLYKLLMFVAVVFMAIILLCPADDTNWNPLENSSESTGAGRVACQVAQIGCK